ncbi:MAG: adenosine deaminase, partial [Pseudomonadota bacterium]
MVAHVPKAEIHCHIEGAVPPDLALKQAAKYGVDIGSIVDGDFYVWSDFTS